MNNERKDTDPKPKNTSVGVSLLWGAILCGLLFAVITAAITGLWTLLRTSTLVASVSNSI